MTDFINYLGPIPAPPEANAEYRVFVHHSHGMWVFSDGHREINSEPFVDGMDVILDHVSGRIPRTVDSVASVWFSFSDLALFDADVSYVLVREEPMQGGYYYRLEGTDLRGWICPVALKYFPTHPERIYFMIVGVLGADGTRRYAKPRKF